MFVTIKVITMKKQKSTARTDSKLSDLATKCTEITNTYIKQTMTRIEGACVGIFSKQDLEQGYST